MILKALSAGMILVLCVMSIAAERDRMARAFMIGGAIAWLIVLLDCIPVAGP